MTTPDPTLAARLAPCPFCGGEASYRTAFGVKCNGCQAGLPCFHHAAIVAWNTRSNQLITAAEADARVEAAVLAEHNRCVDAIKNARVRNTKIGSVEWALACEMIAAIRARGVTG